MFFFKYIKTNKNIIIFYKIVIFILLISYNQYDTVALTIAKNSTYIIAASLFLSILFSYEFLLLPERINYHKFFSKIVVLYSMIHVVSHFYLIFTNVYNFNYSIYYFIQPIYITGLAMTLIVILIFFLSMKIIRKNFFNLFFYVHYFVYVFIFIGFLHSNYYLIFFIMLLIKPFYFNCFKSVKIESNEIIYLTPNYVLLKLLFKSNHHIKNSDCVYLKCRNIAKLEKHPFTVIDSNTNIPEEDSQFFSIMEKKKINYITLCISNNGDWKGNLVSSLIKNKNYDLQNNGLDLHISGYYNTNLKYVKKFDTIVFFCENIGVTPFLSFLHFISKKKNQKKFYNVILYIQIENSKLLTLLEYDIMKFKSIKSINIEYNIYIRNEDTFNVLEKKFYFNFNRGKINYKDIIKNLEDEKNICIYHCGDTKILFKIKYFLYNLKKKNIKLYYF